MRLSSRIKAALCAAVFTACGATSAMAVCRVTDFTDKPLSSLTEVERLAFISQMSPTEFAKLHAAAPGTPNYHALIVQGATLVDAKRAAQAKFAALGVENIDDYRNVWASDFLTDEQQRRYADCISARQPGLTVVGRSESPTSFHLTFTHITPIGVEKITTKLVATYNIANVKELESALTEIGPRDNYTAQTFPLQIVDPKKRAVVIIRAGWETPKAVYIPASPTPDYFK